MKLLIAATLAFGASTLAHADPITIDFETVGSFASIGNYYNGGSDSAGNTGPSLGVTFGGDAIELVNDGTGAANADGSFFANAPSPHGVMAPVGPDAAMNVATGFAGTFTAYYSSTSAVSDGIGIWSGLNGTGTELASFDLLANAGGNPAQGTGCNQGFTVCNFSLASLSFNGTAQSVTFGNAANAALFDNVTIAAVPEPTGVLLMAVGLAGLVGFARRRS